MNFLENNTDIWLFHIDEVDFNVVNDEMLSILNTYEINKANSFFNMEDKNRYLFSHILLRLLLSQYYPNVKPKNWKFINNKYGKLELSKKHGNKLFFNLSRTKNCIAMIFDKKYECGVDIERKRNIISNDIINEVFTYEEKIFYMKSKNKIDLFFTLWTLKESLLKAKGVGFFISPKKIDFSFIEKINLAESSVFFMKDNYQYGLFKLEDKYLSFAINIGKSDEKKADIPILNQTTT